MKKFVCFLLCCVCALPAAACNEKKAAPARIWLLQPATVAAEEDVRKMIRLHDADAFVSFVPSSELNTRLAAAMQRGEAPDVFMVFAESLPDMAEEKRLLDLSSRLPLSNIESEDLPEAAKRACFYQGKSWAVPLFLDVYMLATNRAIVPEPPKSSDELLQSMEKLQSEQIAPFEKLPPEKQALLFEALLYENHGELLDDRQTKLTFTDKAGEEALKKCITLLKNAAKDSDAMGAGEAAFSVLTAMQRREQAEKFPDAEIELSPLFGYDRLQTTALAVAADTPDQKRAFALLEYLQTNGARIASLYKTYVADKNLKPVQPQDKNVVPQISQAKPAPDLCGFEALEKTYLPAAIEKANKGVPAADALQEAADQAADAIWKGKRE